MMGPKIYSKALGFKYTMRIKTSEQVKIIIFYKSAIDSNTFLFNPIVLKIGHS